MIDLLKKSVIAAATVVACVGASAATVDWGDHAAAEFSFSNPTGGLFEDFYTFSLSTAGTVTSVVVSNNNLPGFSIGLGAYGLFSASDTTNPILTFSFSGATGDQQHSSPLLAAGDYFYQVIGSANGTAGGLYTISSNVTPVPEPETYALLLGGLGVVGFVAARRRTRV